jgi:hypothetical protein
VLRFGQSASPPAHQMHIGSWLEERIDQGFDAAHSRDRFEGDVLLLAGVIRSDLRQTVFTERELRAFLGPADRGIVDDVTILGQLHDYTKPDAPLATRPLIPSKISNASPQEGLDHSIRAEHAAQSLSDLVYSFLVPHLLIVFVHYVIAV